MYNLARWFSISKVVLCQETCYEACVWGTRSETVVWCTIHPPLKFSWSTWNKWYERQKYTATKRCLYSICLLWQTDRQTDRQLPKHQIQQLNVLTK